MVRDEYIFKNQSYYTDSDLYVSYVRSRWDSSEPLPPWNQGPRHRLLLHAGGHHHARHHPGVRAGCKWDTHPHRSVLTSTYWDSSALFIVVYFCRKSTGRSTSPKPSTASSTSRASSAPSTYSLSVGVQASCSLYVNKQVFVFMFTNARS